MTDRSPQSRLHRSYHDVVERIRRDIAEGKLTEGDRLPTERDLAATLSYSRNTVREALRALEHAGLIEQQPGVNGGAFIRSNGGAVIRIALEDLVRLGTIRTDELIEIRRVIGAETVRLACLRHDTDDDHALAENLRLTREAADAGDMETRTRRSLEFHCLLARASKNQVVVIITDVLTEMTMEFVRMIGAAPNQFAIESHERLFDHLRAGRCKAAMDEMDDYLRIVQEAYFPPSGAATG